ncbi:hypothetical protein P1S61_40140 [Streptomyces sp. ME08-AFT2]|uniref:hypothetical protein n=1 Tax=Streptomyces sp. ME08-AFT2 TaxID=3028683 RepID=UPI0029BEE4ED|nr:hypothetical protein [Streptomyces sp. ME08-AFT2]MDX3315156.1 hypothetical protein [Streptomyces sp. ME08-AFT2]
MTVGIIHALLRWILGVFAPGTGRRRAGARSAVPADTGIAAQPDAGAVRRLPAARSPYGLPELLDGATIPVRPYVLEVEQTHHGRERKQVLDQQRTRQTQTRRRVALVLAADFGIDLDRHVVGAERAA